MDWILETHAHADHFTAAAYLKRATGALVAIGRGITQLKEPFKALFGVEPDFPADGRQCGRLFADNESLRIGDLEVRAIATPGHTDASLTHLVAGELPPPDVSGIRYLRLPLNELGGAA